MTPAHSMAHTTLNCNVKRHPQCPLHHQHPCMGSYICAAYIAALMQLHMQVASLVK
eukprot:c3205_g1_i1 orf=1-165(-)